MNSRIYLVILFAVLCCSLSCTNAEFRIVNGVGIRMQDSAHSVSIFICEQYSCVGTLVTMKSVVTVASCVFEEQPSTIDILAGMVDIRQLNKGMGQQSKAQSIIHYRLFTQGSRYMDIAVVKVDISFQETETVKQVELCDSVLKPGMDMKVSGWGAVTLHEMPPTPSDILLTTTVSIIKKDECQNSYASFQTWVILPNTIICAKGRGSHMGFRDAGAGAIVDNKLCAVVQGGCIRPNMPNLFTDVTNSIVLEFLRSNIE